MVSSNGGGDGWCHDPSTMQPDASKYGAKENASGCFAQDDGRRDCAESPRVES